MQTPDEYWASPEVGTNVVLLWFMVEGAGMLAAVGYLLTGERPATLAMGLAIVMYWWCRPGLFLNG
jgi:pheromone shutdown protein TraB